MAGQRQALWAGSAPRAAAGAVAAGPPEARSLREPLVAQNVNHGALGSGDFSTPRAFASAGERVAQAPALRSGSRTQGPPAVRADLSCAALRLSCEASRAPPTPGRMHGCCPLRRPPGRPDPRESQCAFPATAAPLPAGGAQANRAGDPKPRTGHPHTCPEPSSLCCRHVAVRGAGGGSLSLLSSSTVTCLRLHHLLHHPVRPVCAAGEAASTWSPLSMAAKWG